jgi:hypothetical protein
VFLAKSHLPAGRQGLDKVNGPDGTRVLIIIIMIKFFRRIRKKMADDNRPVQYMRYAAGEIALVVIGILIALQINNWNEERKRAQHEHKILLALKSDFIESKMRLNATMINQNNCIRRSRALISIYEGKMALPITDSIKVFLELGAFTWYRAELVTGAYDALINTGDSELITNENLVRLLAEYFSILNSGFEDQETSMNNLNNMQIIAEPVLLPLSLPLLRERIGLDKTSDPDKEAKAVEYLFQQEAFFGHLYHKTGIEYLRYEIQNDLMNRITEILSIIDKELE